MTTNDGLGISPVAWDSESQSGQVAFPPARRRGYNGGMTNRLITHMYRVMGIRLNGQRVAMGHGLTSEEAKRIRKALVEANVFDGITIEVDHCSGGEFPTTGGLFRLTSPSQTFRRDQTLCPTPPRVESVGLGMRRARKRPRHRTTTQPNWGPEDV